MPTNPQCPRCGGTLIKSGCCSWDCLDCNANISQRELAAYQKSPLTFTRSIHNTVSVANSTIADDGS